MKSHQISSKQYTTLFQFFNELAIIQQLATTAFNQVMPEGLHVSHFIAINHLARVGDGATPIQMANALQLTKATMTHTLNILRERGFIEILPNPDDGRSKLVYLTTQGRQFQKKAIFSLAPIFEIIGRECDVTELLATFPALQSLREVLDGSRNG